jgi:hypothetical protein
MMPESREAGAPQKIATDAMRQSKNVKETMLSEILQGCFSKIRNLSLQIIWLFQNRLTKKSKEDELKDFAFLACS